MIYSQWLNEVQLLVKTTQSIDIVQHSGTTLQSPEESTGIQNRFFAFSCVILMFA
jgi:hypothetical protein